MAKLDQPRLANATPQYDPSQQNQIIKTLEQMIFQLNNNYTQNVQDVNEAEAWFFISRGGC
jgi:hypothetical protein